jgi:signal transduction histidine kinase
MKHLDLTSPVDLFAESMRETYVDTDRVFGWLMIVQWIVGILLAVVVSPQTWIGDQSSVHVHVWAAVVWGGAISIVPVFLAWRHPGEVYTRHVMAVAQMMWSALLIHLTGGRIETHFHVFGSLAFLAFYRDWHVVVTATVVVAADHFVRGVWWPQSVFGVMVESPYRWIEHAAWVIFEDIILIRSCIRGRREARTIAEREAGLAIANEVLEEQIRVRQQAEGEVRRLYENLAHAHEEAIAASQVKSQFLANMSHELRTPLNAIIGYSELMQLLAAKKKDTTYSADLEKINKAGKHLLTLINDILDISKIEAGGMQLERQVFSVDQILDELRETIEPLAARNQNCLEIARPAESALVHADPVRLKQCLLNLLSNACKFTRAGRVALMISRQRAGDQGELLVMEVTDTGIGLTPDQISRLFQPFTQADASTTRKFGGTGLGLAITKQLCEAMGGSVAVESTLGVGSRFRIALPVYQAERLTPLGA